MLSLFEIQWKFSFQFFYLPFAVIVPPPAYLVHKQLNLLYQFWIHTEVISTIGPLEWILNTPSHHRVHHGRNPYCIDKNYGTMLPFHPPPPFPQWMTIIFFSSHHHRWGAHHMGSFVRYVRPRVGESCIWIGTSTEHVESSVGSISPPDLHHHKFQFKGRMEEQNALPPERSRVVSRETKTGWYKRHSSGRLFLQNIMIFYELD